MIGRASGRCLTKESDATSTLFWPAVSSGSRSARSWGCAPSMDGDENVGWLVSRTTLSGHLRADSIRIFAPSMISGRSGKWSAGSGNIEPAISRRTTSAHPTTAKYLAMGTADCPCDLSDLGRLMTAMLWLHSRCSANRSVCHAGPRLHAKRAPIRLDEILHHPRDNCRHPKHVRAFAKARKGPSQPSISDRVPDWRFAQSMAESRLAAREATEEP